MHSLIWLVMFGVVIYLCRKEYLDEVKYFKAKYGMDRKTFLRYKYKMMGRKPTFWEKLDDYFWSISK